MTFFDAPEGSAAEPRLAASLILIRDGLNGLEAFLMRRSEQLSFAGGFYSFPGGVLDKEDEASVDNKLDALKAAAIRETFEESGFGLFAGEDLDLNIERLKQQAQWPRLSLSGNSFYDWLAHSGYSADFSALHFQSCWITPVASPKRYETYFYLAKAPEQQAGECDGEEMVASAWINIVEFLQAEPLDHKLMFPTEMNLRWLAKFESTQDVFIELKTHQAPVVMPEVVRESGSTYLVIPQDSGYDIYRQKVN